MCKIKTNMSTKEEYASIIVTNSPVPTGGRNLTGNPRIVRDAAVDLYNLVQKWNLLSIEGNSTISSIMNLKTAAWDKTGAAEMYPEGLQGLCDQLETTVSQLEAIVTSMGKITEQYKGMARLEDFQREMRSSGTPVRKAVQQTLFLTWPTTKFGEVAEEHHSAYLQEYRIRRCIAENVAHCEDKDSLFLHSIAWVHQVQITAHVKMLLESLLAETGHR